jgi:CheY-like chemotaxis protein
VGSGAAFVVRLPLVEPAMSQDQLRSAVQRRISGRRVLVVDDNRDAADSMAEMVELLGHAAEVAYDGPTALEKARANPPDVVLCDVGLPGMSGYDIARALRANDMDGVQLVAVTGYAQPEDLKAAVEAGFDRHIAKPASADDIMRLLG